MLGGLMQLVAVGVPNDAINNNPEVTFFNSVYNRTSRFASDSIEPQMEYIKVSAISGECPICLEDYPSSYNRVKYSHLCERTEEEEPDVHCVVANCCGKIFHYKCMLQWAERTKMCPHCRGQPMIVSAEPEDDGAPRFGNPVHATIPRNGDLVTDFTLELEDSSSDDDDESISIGGGGGGMSGGLLQLVAVGVQDDSTTDRRVSRKVRAAQSKVMKRQQQKIMKRQQKMLQRHKRYQRKR